MANEDERPTGSVEDGKQRTRTETVEEDTPASEHRIGPYRILRELGHGGMGTVFLATRADEHFHMRVALKVIRSGSDSAEVIRHFKRERQILAGLDHPNIAKLLDGGTTEDGLPYFVMEHIEGEQIGRYCDSRSLSITDRLKLFQSVCAAVQYAHRNLVVHRDIKPPNILVADDGSPRLLDFGIAKLLNPELAGEAHTGTAMAMTPSYASPEQLRGERITTATDVYSLGVVLYELLTGRHPYRLASRHPNELLKALSEQEPEKASTAVERKEEIASPRGDRVVRITAEGVAKTREGTPEVLKRRLRGDLDNILMMALRKEPQSRYASVEAFSEDLQFFLDGLPVKARRPTLGYRAGKFIRRHAAGVAAATGVFVLLIAFAVAMAVQSTRVAKERDVARKEQETAQRVSTFMVDLFRVSDPSEARGNTITAREVLDKASEKIGTELKDQPEVRARLMDTMGDVYRNLGLPDEAVRLSREALETRKAVLGNEHPDVARSLNNLANVLYEKGDFAGAEALHREALALRRKLFGNEHPDVAKSLNNLANALYEKADDAGAEALHREALALRLKLFGSRHAEVAASLGNLANVLYTKGDAKEAEALYRDALAMRRELLGNEHPDVAKSLNNLANVLDEKGDYAGAEALYREAIALGRKLLGNEHPEVAKSLDNLANVLDEKGEYTAAEALHREAIALGRKVLGVDHPQVAMRLTGLARTLCLEQRPAEAESSAREALAILHRKSFPGDHPFIAEAESTLGGALTLLRRYEQAEPLLLRSYPALKAKTGERSVGTREALRRILGLYEAWGKPDKAAPFLAEDRSRAESKS